MNQHPSDYWPGPDEALVYDEWDTWPGDPDRADALRDAIGYLIEAGKRSGKMMQALIGGQVAPVVPQAHFTFTVQAELYQHALTAFGVQIKKVVQAIEPIVEAHDCDLGRSKDPTKKRYPGMPKNGAFVKRGAR